MNKLIAFTILATGGLCAQTAVVNPYPPATHLVPAATNTGGGATIQVTGNAIKGDGAGNGIAVTGTGTNCVLVNGSSAACGSGSGTVTVVGAGSLTSTALVTGGGSQTIQTPNSSATLDASGNEVVNSVTTSGAAAGTISLTANATPGGVVANSFGFMAPATLTNALYLQPPNADPAANSVPLLSAPSSNVSTITWQGTSGTGNIARVTSPTFITPALGTPASGVGTNLTGIPLSGIIGGTANAVLVGQGSSSAPISGDIVNVVGTSVAVPVPTYFGSTSILTYETAITKSVSGKTFYVGDRTATTGSTLVTIDAGAGQSGNVVEVRANNATPGAGSIVFRVLSDGSIGIGGSLSGGTTASFSSSITGANFAFIGGSGNGLYPETAVNDTGFAVESLLVSSGAPRQLMASSFCTGSTFPISACGGQMTNTTVLIPSYTSTGTKFTISGCSASTTVGGATAGTFLSGTTGACTVIITMNGATGLTAPNGWTCSAYDLTTSANLISQSASSATTCTITGTTVSGDKISFMAMAF